MHYYRFQALRNRLPPLPHPMAPSTFTTARLDWQALETQDGQAWLALHQQLLAIRHREIAPRLALIGGHAGSWRLHHGALLEVCWSLRDASQLVVMANLSDDAIAIPPPNLGVIHATHPTRDHIPPWFVAWYVRNV
ncbi:MAG: DUF3459 domain-containing protein [Magnetococcales bacterium]|nr:DUF3459 domain-containing protein [Magnetococcales bacterium]